jgi:SAM-dependent methyltransferase
MVPHCCSLLRERLDRLESRPGLLVGCGSGDEVAYMRRAFRNPHLVGIDVGRSFSSLARAQACVLVADAASLPFPAESFDFAAAFHSLEHVASPCQVLEEIARVLRPGAWLYLGVPNKSRLIGYVGAFRHSPGQKITLNLKDFWARLQGRFENVLGAHAGFEARELVSLLGKHFESVQLVTSEYVRFKYCGRLPKPLLDFLLAPQVINYSVAAHYALCQK